MHCCENSSILIRFRKKPLIPFVFGERCGVTNACSVPQVNRCARQRPHEIYVFRFLPMKVLCCTQAIAWRSTCQHSTKFGASWAIHWRGSELYKNLATRYNVIGLPLKIKRPNGTPLYRNNCMQRIASGKPSDDQETF